MFIIYIDIHVYSCTFATFTALGTESLNALDSLAVALPTTTSFLTRPLVAHVKTV